MSNINLIELSQQLEQKRAEYKGKYESYEEKTMPNGEKARDIPANDLEGLQALMKDINDLGEKYEKAYEADKFAKENQKALEDDKRAVNRIGLGEGKEKSYETKSLGELFVNSKEFKENAKKCDFNLVDFKTKDWLSGMEFKATMTTSANGYPPEVLREGGITFSAQRPPQIINVLPMRRTGQNGIKFMAETVFTNTAAAKAEGATADEATLTFAETSISIVRIPVFIPVTEEQLEDVEGMEDIINNRLILMVQQTLDTQVLNGSGVAPNMRGIRNFTGVQTQAKGADPAFDAIRKAIDKVNVTGRAQASALLMHSTDWMNLELTRTADGLYILGNPASGIDRRLWGLPVVETQVLTAGTAHVGDFARYSELVMRTGIELAISDSHSDYFIRNQFAIRATVRAAVEVRRGAAFCDVTGL